MQSNSAASSVNVNIRSLQAHSVPPSKVRHSCRILVVDDEYIIRTQLLFLLKRSGYDVRAVASGEEALQALEVGNFQVLLTDWQMPHMDGLALCRHVRLGRQTGDVYVIMLTVRDQENDLQSGLAAGVDDYMIKGAPNEDVLSRLHYAREIVRSDFPRRKANRKKRLDRSESHYSTAPSVHGPVSDTE